jgi:hypothetical protein
MPIKPLLANGAFSPEDVIMLTSAFEGSLRDLGLVDRKDPIVLSVAQLVIALAQGGERDPIKLRDRVVKVFDRKQGL